VIDIIPIPRSDDDVITLTATRGGVRFALRLRWWDRLSGWYLTMTTPDGVLVSPERRMGAQAEVTADPTAPGHPPGRLYLTGAVDLDRRSDLWECTLAFIPEAFAA
jgi:hypothetical protein